MRRRYLFVSSFFVGLLCLGVWGGYQFQNEQKEVVTRENTSQVDTMEEIRVNDAMTLVLEEYDGSTDVSTQEEMTIPVEFAGLNRDELEKCLKEHPEVLAEEEQTIPDSLELIHFSKDKLVVRSTYFSEDNEGFFLKISSGELVIYQKDQTTVYEETGIQQENIPEQERKRLEVGIEVENEKDLYAILENISS